MTELTNKENSFKITEIFKEAWKLISLKGVKLGIWKIMGISFIVILLLHIVFGIINFAISFFIKNPFFSTTLSTILQSFVMFIQVAFASIIIKCNENVIKQKNETINNFSSFYNINYKTNKNIILTFIGILLGFQILFVLIGLTTMLFAPNLSNFDPKNLDPKILLYIVPPFILLVTCIMIVLPFLTGIILPFSLINAHKKNVKTFKETLFIIKETFKVIFKHFFSYILFLFLPFILFIISLVIIIGVGALVSALLTMLLGQSIIIKICIISFFVIAILILLAHLVPLMSNILAVAYTKENFDEKLQLAK